MIGRKAMAMTADGATPVAAMRPKKRRLSGVAQLIGPALQAAVGAMAFVFLFAAVVPAAWLNALAWQLYLDQISPLTTPPLGMAARIGFAVILALLAGLIAFMVMLAVAKPPAAGRAVMTRRVAERARRLAGEQDAIPAVRRADAHPDAPPRAPFRADRDLAPPDGNTPPRPAWMDELAAGDPRPADDSDDELLDLGGLEEVHGADAAADDRSLGALVARFEAGLARRRTAMTAAQSAAASALPPASNDRDDPLELGSADMIDDDEPTVDLGLEAALSTLQRMSRRAVG